MALAIRDATSADLDQVAALTRAGRDRLAAWAPRWWRKAAIADQIHPAWLQHLIESDGSPVRVAVEAGQVVGCVASMAQRQQWFVDDVAVVDPARWADVGVALLLAVRERPALTCTATADDPRQTASLDAGLAPVSSYWIRATAVPAEAAGGRSEVRPLPASVDLPLGPRHTFGGPFDPEARGALAFADGDGGLLVGSPSIPAPPVYDPGGPVAVIDRVLGQHQRLLRMALDLTAARGDVLLAVVVGTDDAPLEASLEDLGFERTVEVFAWPDDASA